MIKRWCLDCSCPNQVYWIHTGGEKKKKKNQTNFWKMTVTFAAGAGVPQPLPVGLQGLATSKPQLRAELWVWPVSRPSGAESCWGYQLPC